MQTNPISSTPRSLDPNNPALRRIPKLAVRNKSSGTALQSDTSPSSEESSNEQRPAYPSEEIPARDVTPIASTPILKTQPTTHQRQSSSSSAANDKSSQARKPAKRKSAGVLGFLTLKEPSTSALEAFAEHEKKRAAQKGGKSVAMVMPGVSSQKLPEHVPKVNSKWDGLPEGARRKSTDRRDKDDRSVRASRDSLNPSRPDSPKRPYGSLSSKPSVRQPQDKKRPAVHVTEVAGDKRPDSQGSSSLRQTHAPLLDAATHPALRGRQRSQSNGDDTGSNLSERDVPEVPSLQEHGYSSGTWTSPDASPRTPAADMSSFPISDSEDVIVKSAGPDVLAPPSVSLGRMAPVIPPAAPRKVARQDSLLSPPSAARDRSTATTKSKKDDVAPWEMFEPPPEPAAPAGPSSQQESSKRTKRFGYKLGRK